MAVDMFIKIGDIKGESMDSKHKGEIDVLSWSWGMSQSGNAHVGGGAGAGKVNVQDLTLTKYVDSCTPLLMLKVCNGKHYPEALLTVRKAGENPVEYLKIKITIGKKYFINVGSVGQPRDGDWRSAYVIYDTKSREVELRRLSYDIAATQEKIIKAGLPERLAKRLEMGK
jgi:type VI protein secretion system component Hcp